MSQNTVSLTRPFVVRGACVTASATLTNGTNTTLLTGDSAYKLDLVEISISNTSTVAVPVTLKDDGTTVRNFNIPLSGTVQANYSIPLPQSAAGGIWSVDTADDTNTTINVEAIFIKN